MQPAERMSVPMMALTAIIGIGAGILLQQWRSNEGIAPFAPPYSLPASITVIAAVLVILTFRLKAAVEHREGKQVNPFHAIRLLAAARAAQITGILVGGFAGGLLISLTTRPVAVQTSVWLPMTLTVVASLVLVTAGIFAENNCRVPPQDEDGATKTGANHTEASQSEAPEGDAPEIA